MAKLVWDKPGDRFYESGVDHGVLYPNGSEGVPWNGLVSVEKSVSGGETEAYYIDGLKYYDSVANEDFQATVQAFTYPAEFAACEGRKLIAPGLFAANQPRETFGMAWRTKIGNDTDGIDHGYKIHMAYNVTASPSSKSYETMGDSPVPVNFSWEINAVPVLPGADLIDMSGDPSEWVWPEGFGMAGWPNGSDGITPVRGWRAVAYIFLDPSKVNPLFMNDLENRLFGSLHTPAYLPSQTDVLNMLTGTDVPYLYPFDWTEPE